jgi:hypothetical protein
MCIDTIADDNARFIEIVRRVVDASVHRDSPGSLRVIRIDNWFGERWRGFAGKMLGAVGVSRGRLVIPPFVPSRVNSEVCWSKGDSGYVIEPDFSMLHRRIRSEENLRRYFDQLCPDTVAVWFSSKSASNGRGSVMVYSDVGMKRTVSWYTELTDTKNWKPNVANGITTSDFLKLVASDQTEAEQAGTGQPATRPLFESEGSDKPQPEAEGRSR